jgi:DNA-binding transcriptional regulator GbsR (MarR family)
MARAYSDPAPAADADRAEFIEAMAQMLEGFGLPLMAGRILSALLVASPPEQTAAQLSERLQASRGSISTMTRLLEAPGLIERLRKPGDRRTYYRMAPGGWHGAMKREADQMTALRTLAERGARIMRDEPEEARRGIDETVDFLRFWEGELEAVVARWRSERPGDEDGR